MWCNPGRYSETATRSEDWKIYLRTHIHSNSRVQKVQSGIYYNNDTIVIINESDDSMRKADLIITMNLSAIWEIFAKVCTMYISRSIQLHDQMDQAHAILKLDKNSSEYHNYSGLYNYMTSLRRIMYVYIIII